MVIAERRKYHTLERFAIEDFSHNVSIQSIAQPIESVFSAIDCKNGKQLKDDVIIAGIDRFLDKYFYKDEILNFSNDKEQDCFQMIENIFITKKTELTVYIKVLGGLRASVVRRTTGKREYLDFISSFV